MAGTAWFARRYKNGRETSVANRVGKPLKLLSPCSPLGSANRQIFGCRQHAQCREAVSRQRPWMAFFKRSLLHFAACIRPVLEAAEIVDALVAHVLEQVAA